MYGSLKIKLKEFVKVQDRKSKTTIVRIEIDFDTYEKYKKIVKSKNQMLKGYNNDLFYNAVRKEIENH